MEWILDGSKRDLSFPICVFEGTPFPSCPRSENILLPFPNPTLHIFVVSRRSLRHGVICGLEVFGNKRKNVVGMRGLQSELP